MTTDLRFRFNFSRRLGTRSKMRSAYNLSENMMERGNNGDLRIVQEIECEFVD
jgi:hypothetical protein